MSAPRFALGSGRTCAAGGKAQKATRLSEGTRSSDMVYRSTIMMLYGERRDADVQSVGGRTKEPLGGALCT